jgi:hypothetical protein
LDDDVNEQRSCVLQKEGESQAMDFEAWLNSGPRQTTFRLDQTEKREITQDAQYEDVMIHYCGCNWQPLRKCNHHSDMRRKPTGSYSRKRLAWHGSPHSQTIG